MADSSRASDRWVGWVIGSLIGGLFGLLLFLSIVHRHMAIVPPWDHPDPAMFALPWDIILDALAALVILSIVVERALAVVFESKAFIDWSMADGKREDLKPLIAAAVCIGVCWIWSFDLFAIILSAREPSIVGSLLTGIVVAGGSKGSIKLFRDILNWQSSAAKEARSVAKGQSTASMEPDDEEQLQQKIDSLDAEKQTRIRQLKRVKDRSKTPPIPKL